MDALSQGGDPRAAPVRRRRAPQRVFTTVGPEQEYFLIDEQYYYERPDLVNTGRTLFGAKPPKGHELDDHYFGSIPERVLACMLEVRARAGQARRADQDPPQRGRARTSTRSRRSSRTRTSAPTTSSSRCRCMQNVARRYGLVCLLHEKPFAGVNGSGKHNNWSMGTDTGSNLLEPGRHAAREPAVPVLLHGGHPGRQQAPGAAAGVDRQRRPGPPPGRQRGAAGDHLDLPRRRAAEGVRGDRVRAGDGGTAEGFLGLGTAGAARRCPSTAATATAPARSPSPATSSSSARSARSSRSALPNTVLNTIVAEAIDDAVRRARAGARRRRRRSRRRSRRSSRTACGANKQIVFDGDNYSEEWHAEAEQRGLLNLRTTPDALPELRRATRRSRCSSTTACCPSASSSRATRCSLEQYAIKVNIEAETAADDRPHDAPAGRRPPPRELQARRASSRARRGDRAACVDEFVDGDRGARGGQRRPHAGRRRSLERAKYMRDTVLPGDGRASARSPTGSSRSSPTTSGRCRSTRRSCSSSRHSMTAGGSIHQERPRDPDRDAAATGPRGAVLQPGSMEVTSRMPDETS